MGKGQGLAARALATPAASPALPAAGPAAGSAGDALAEANLERFLHRRFPAQSVASATAAAATLPTSSGSKPCGWPTTRQAEDCPRSQTNVPNVRLKYPYPEAQEAGLRHGR